MTSTKIFVEGYADRIARLLDESWVNHFQLGHYEEIDDESGARWVNDESLRLIAWCKFGDGWIRTTVRVSADLVPLLQSGDPDVLRLVREDLRHTTWFYGQRELNRLARQKEIDA